MAGLRLVTGSLFCGALSASTACGTATTATIPSASPASPTPSGHVLRGTVTTVEDATLTASFQTPLRIAVNGNPTASPNGYTCSSYAAGSNGTFLAPDFSVTSDDRGFYFTGMVTSGYGGPGDYSSTGTPTLGGTIDVATGVGGGQAPAYSIFRSRIDGSSTMTVNADGSGRFDFTTWGSDEVRGDTGTAAVISGTVTWMCR